MTAPQPKPRRLSLTGDEVRMGMRRAADSPRLKYLARAADGRRPFVTVALIKRALAMAKDEGVLLDPLNGEVLADQKGAPKPKRKKKAPKRSKTPPTASEPAPEADAPDDAPDPDAPDQDADDPQEG